MKTITGKLLTPDGVAVPNANVSVHLRPIEAFRRAIPNEQFAATAINTKTDVTGNYSFSLVENDTVSPDGTYYTIIEDLSSFPTKPFGLQTANKATREINIRVLTTTPEPSTVWDVLLAQLVPVGSTGDFISITEGDTRYALKGEGGPPGPPGPPGSASALTRPYVFSSNTAMADPGGGFLRLNAAVTQVAISKLDANGVDISGPITSIRPGDDIYLSLTAGPSAYYRLRVLSTFSSNGAWFSANVQVMGTPVAFANNAPITVVMQLNAGTGIQKYADKATLDSILPAATSPLGTFAVTLADGQLWELNDRSGAALWTPPWNTAWGRVATGLAGANLNVTASATFLTATIKPIPNRTYQAFFTLAARQNVQDGNFGVNITDSAGTVINGAVFPISLGPTEFCLVSGFVEFTSTSLQPNGIVLVKLSASLGSVDAIAAGAILSIVDLGPRPYVSPI